ncbi:MAG TPA: uracil-DNA glycosylase family protein [Candidatus Hydrogenedens sp.]|nr:uracil-DNA glycosylase family protein [Candidatus Hydrogenedens sp.]
MCLTNKKFISLIEEIKKCRYCDKRLPLGANPILRVGNNSPILIVGQAPGLKVHKTGLPWNDPSGDKLRKWLNVSREQFYDTRYFTIIPTGFCYPGRNPRGADLPPREECIDLWWDKIMPFTSQYKLILLMGRYAHKLFLGEYIKPTLTETVLAWKDYYPPIVPCPHPSFRNNLWIKQNSWFIQEVVPFIQAQVHLLIQETNYKQRLKT